MNLSKKVIILTAICLSLSSYVYGSSLSWPVVTITGQVRDKVTLKPIAQAKVTAQYGSLKKVSTDQNGVFSVSFVSVSSWLRLCKLSVAKSGYLSENRILLLPYTGIVEANFNLQDSVPPYLVITSPIAGQQIFAACTIKFSYQDYGSGVDQASLKILANNRDITSFVTQTTGRYCLCVIPKEHPLDIGPCTLSVQIKDFAGNQANTAVSVTVIPEIDYYIRLGKQALLNNDILSSYRNFALALNVAPANPEANFYYAITRLSALPLTSAPVFNLFRNAGYSGPNGAALTPADLNPFNLKAQPPAGLAEFRLSATFPSGRAFQDLLRYTLIPELTLCIYRLETVLRSADFNTYLETIHPFSGVSTVRIDYGDVAILKSMLCLIQAKAYEATVYNLDADLAQLSGLFTTGLLDARYVLENYPQLLRVEDVPQSLLARGALLLAIDAYLRAYNFMKAETGDHSSDLFSLSSTAQYRQEAELFAQQLSDIRKSLVGAPDTKFLVKTSQLINLSRFFSSPFDLRRALDTDSAQYLLTEHFLPQIDYARNNLSKAGMDYQEFLPPDNSFYTKSKKDVDLADILSARLSLEQLRMLSLLALGYNLNFNAQEEALQAQEGNTFSLNNFFSAHPDFLHLSDSAKIASAREAFGNIVSLYKEISDYLLNNEDSQQGDDLVIIDDYFRANELNYRAMLDGLNSMNNTLLNPAPEAPESQFHLNLGELFIQQKNLRDLLPNFDENNRIIAESWPDATFGGIVPDNEF